MKKRDQHIKRLQILLAGFIIFAHTVIPHHHHYETVHSDREQAGCEKPAHEGHHQNPFQDCHAFNLLVAEKPSSLLKNGKFNPPAAVAPVAVQTGTRPETGILSIAEIAEGRNYSQRFLTGMPLRAPPVQI